MQIPYEHYTEAAEFIRARLSRPVRIGLILGSGLGPLADSAEDASILPYHEIPHWPQSTVEGHAGRLVAGLLEDQSILFMQGRVHFYEGHPIQSIAFPIRVMRLLGIDTLIVTNAAGGVNLNFKAGDLMLIEDHINFVGMAGNNPLTGPNDERFGPRFPVFTHAYDPELRQLARRVAEQEGISLQKGVYIWLSGPTYETPADIRMIRSWGADAVGMSTVPEVIAAVHCGMRVLGISTITNMTIDQTETENTLAHEEVIEMGRQTVPRLARLLRGILQNIG